MDKKNYVCIACPNSCKLTVWEDAEGIHVEGAVCPRGVKHGENEYTCPKRMLTTTVMINNGSHPRIAVVSSDEIPKSQLEDCLAQLYALEVEAPVTRGQVLIADICGTGVDIVASRSMKRK